MKPKQIIGIIFLASIIGPLAINEAYNLGGYSTNWDAADMLNYFGLLLGGAVTLAALSTTILYGDKQREKDRAEWQKRERCQFVLRPLFSSLHDLNCNYLLAIKKDIDEKSSSRPHRLISHMSAQQPIKFSDLVSPQKLSYLLESANGCKNLEASISFDEDGILHEAIRKIYDYADEYTSLLFRLSDQCDQPAEEIIIANILEKIKMLHNEKYEDLVVSVREGIKKFEGCVSKTV